MLDRYLSQTAATCPGEYSVLLDALPKSMSGIVSCVQGLFIHVFWASRYGVVLGEAEKQHVHARTVRTMLATMMSIDDRPLREQRPLERRFFGNCRDHAVFLCAVLRHKGIPARARCGFAKYFRPGFEDHWVTEYWNGSRWVMVDAQLDKLQRDTLQITFDPLDMQPGLFISAAEAWLMCREGRADPNKFGIFDMHGLWFVRGNLVRELASLSEVETMPWDLWGLIKGSDADLKQHDFALLDQVATLIMADDPLMYEVYSQNPGLKVPSGLGG